jgi:hypothetical protein
MPTRARTAGNQMYKSNIAMSESVSMQIFLGKHAFFITAAECTACSLKTQTLGLVARFTGKPFVIAGLGKYSP